MQKNKDGSVTLTKREFTELNGSYQKLMRILGEFPTSLDVFMSSHEEYLRVCKWEALLSGNTFNRRDYE